MHRKQTSSLFETTHSSVAKRRVPRRPRHLPSPFRAGLAKKGAFVEEKVRHARRASSERHHAPRDARDRPRSAVGSGTRRARHSQRRSELERFDRSEGEAREPKADVSACEGANTPNRAFTFRHARVLRPRVGAGLPRREAPTHPAQDGRAPQLPRERIARYGETRAWPRRARRRASGMRFSRVDRFSSLFPRVRLTRAPSVPSPNRGRRAGVRAARDAEGTPAHEVRASPTRKRSRRAHAPPSVDATVRGMPNAFAFISFIFFCF